MGLHFLENTHERLHAARLAVRCHDNGIGQGAAREQVRQALSNVADVLREAGGVPQNIVRMTWYVTNKREYLAAGADIGRSFRELIGNYSIAMTAVQVSALMEDRAKVEIEVTAVLPD